MKSVLHSAGKLFWKFLAEEKIDAPGDSNTNANKSVESLALSHTESESSSVKSMFQSAEQFLRKMLVAAFKPATEVSVLTIFLLNTV